MGIEFAIEERTRVDGTPVVAIAGEIDLFAAPEFKQAVQAAMDRDTPRVIVDLGAATFIDSSSLGVLIGAHRRLDGRGGQLVVAANHPAIVKTLGITGLDTIFTLVPSVEDVPPAAPATAS